MTEPKLPPLPETVYGLFYEAQASDDDEGYQELFDEPAYTADQMKTYALQAIAANTPAVPDVSGLLSEYDMDGSAFAVDLLAMLAAPQPQPVAQPEQRWPVSSAVACWVTRALAASSAATRTAQSTNRRSEHGYYRRTEATNPQRNWRRPRADLPC